MIWRKEVKLAKKALYFISSFIVPIEFLFAVCFAFSIYRVVFIRYYLGFWAIKYIIAIALFVVFLICSLYIQIRKKHATFFKIAILLLIPVGMLYIFFIPPSFVPDEQTHMLKAYEVSTGKLVTEQTKDRLPKIEVPRFLKQHTLDSIQKYDQFNLALKEKTNYSDTVRVKTTAAGYCFVSYMLSGLGFLIGRLLSINGILAFYLARILNYAFFIFAIYIALKIIPFGKYVIAVISFLPMTLQQVASVSADSVLISGSLLFIAMTLYIKYKPNTFKIRDKVAYSALSLLIMLSKVAYFPILGLSLLLLDTENKDDSMKKKWIYLILNVILAVGIGGLWYAYSQHYPDVFMDFREKNHINPSEQIKMILSEPSHFNMAIKNFFLNDAGMLISTMGLPLGWLNINIGMGPVLAFLIMLVLSPFLGSEVRAISILDRICFWIITLCTYLIIVVGFYITWTGVGAEDVAGTQGRYFLPVLALPFMAAYNQKSHISFKNQELVFPLIMVMLDSAAVYNLSLFFL